MKYLTRAEGGPGVEWAHGLVHLIWQWEQLWGRWNWRTWNLTLLNVEYEKDGIIPGWEITVVVLGCGMRLRINQDWSLTPAGREINEALTQLTTWEKCPLCGYGRVKSPTP